MMTAQIIDITKPSNAEILTEVMVNLERCSSCLIEMKHELKEPLFHMVHSIQFYIERYLLDENEAGDIYNLPKPDLSLYYADD